MAILPVEKVQIVVYKGIKDTFLENLQKEGIVHISELDEATPKPSENLMRINDALTRLSGHKKRSPLSMFFPIKRPMTFDAFSSSADSYNYRTTVQKIEDLKSTQEKTLMRSKQLQDTITVLSPWTPLTDELASLRALRQTDALMVIIPSRETLDDLPQHLGDIAYSVEHVNTAAAVEYCVFFVKKEHSHRLRNILIEQECEIADFRDYSGMPADIIASCTDELAETQRYLEDLAQQEQQLAQELVQLENTSDHLANEQLKDQVAEALPETIRTTNIIGWVLKRHLKRHITLIGDDSHGCVHTRPDFRRWFEDAN